jgi:hypothetical protein
MEQFPYPPLPTEQESIAEIKIIRELTFFAPPLLVSAFIFLALLVALCISYNFNPLQWLE